MPEDVIAANNAIKSLRAELRMLIKQIGDWYGYNAPTKVEAKIEDLIDYDKVSDKALKELYYATKAEA